MSSLAVALPLATDSIDGFAMIKSIKRLIKQNLKMLILTNPGERVMEPDFGVGLNRYLFLNFDGGTYAKIDSKIREQVAKYLPVVQINRISFDAQGQDVNRLGISLMYSIPNIGVKDLLEFTI
tara:strand:+ start:386 stop:754 length:369 start_codon:yes stop_codon:yes gene_type:complete